MLYSKRNGLSHQDWFVQVVPCGPAFSFCCHHANRGSHTNGAIYPTTEAAIIAGCQFINRELAIAALGEVLNEWADTDTISVEEYWKASHFNDRSEW